MHEWVKYSKSSADVAAERRALTAVAEDSLRRQRETVKRLAAAPRRSSCALCHSSVSSDPILRHRGAQFFVCVRCGHLQSLNVPENFGSLSDSEAFSRVYPALPRNEITSRVDRIYAPKLDWILEAANRHGLTQSDMAAKSWLELGCGAGYFLHALERSGLRDVKGLDFSADLVEQANCHNSVVHARQTSDMLGDLKGSAAEVIVAFFVLEHLEDPHLFWEIMSSKPSGTLLIFSVPMLGMTTLFENAFEEMAARNLDCEVHTQLYTERSISFSLFESGYRKISDWLFGQDAQDLIAHIKEKLMGNGDWGDVVNQLAQLDDLVNPIQEVIDRARLCDARHVLAVKL